ncbi:hypothetical protein [Agrobacterium pusense]|uniref:hypothetical protein n=1 Tax=Agrobacterium pusense TaxID=648995 RepID=UPI0021CE640A|nr:hypothetical protein [Agrobacterium pusense]UXT89764.1 hypothetical protein FY130_08460 [Agrobacterium pusense]
MLYIFGGLHQTAHRLLAARHPIIEVLGLGGKPPDIGFNAFEPLVGAGLDGLHFHQTLFMKLFMALSPSLQVLNVAAFVDPDCDATNDHTHECEKLDDCVEVPFKLGSATYLHVRILRHWLSLSLPFNFIISGTQRPLRIACYLS